MIAALGGGALPGGYGTTTGVPRSAKAFAVHRSAKAFALLVGLGRSLSRLTTNGKPTIKPTTKPNNQQPTTNNHSPFQEHDPWLVRL